MDRTKLIEKLQTFKETCQKKGFIEGELGLQEAYPGIIPTSFIVKLSAKPQWLAQFPRSQAINQLIDELWETTDTKTRESIYTISLYNCNDNHGLDEASHKEAA